MESLMSDLLATARGEEPKHTSHFKSYHHADNFIADEIRMETMTRVTDQCPAAAQVYQSFSPVSSDCDSSYDTDTHSSPSYILCDCSDDCSSPPTYIRGDFYDLTPPDPEVDPGEYREDSVSSLPFSIDSILGLGQSLQEDQSVTETPAIVTSSWSSFQFYDWNYFQTNSSNQKSLPDIFWCHACKTYCSDLKDARSHQASHELYRVPCNLGSTFFSKHGYVTPHFQTDYSNRMQCGLCDKVVTKCFFGKHLRTHEILKCHICGMECATETILSDHLNTHDGNKPFSCKTCGVQFSDRRKLQNHTRLHRAYSVSCRYCKKTFKNRYSCKVHERIHTGSKPFVCTEPGCNMAFPQKVQLHLHMNKH